MGKPSGHFGKHFVIGTVSSTLKHACIYWLQVELQDDAVLASTATYCHNYSTSADVLHALHIEPQACANKYTNTYLNSDSRPLSAILARAAAVGQSQPDS